MDLTKVGPRLLSWARGLMRNDVETSAPLIRPPEMAPGVVADGVRLANDSALSANYGYINTMNMGSAFLGYPALAQLTQIPEYRMLSEKTAQAMVRKWIKIVAKGDGDKTERIAAIEAEMERLKARELFQEVAIHDGFFGRAQLFIDLGEQHGESLGNPLTLHGATLKGKPVRKLKLVEAMFTYPDGYTSTNPLADDYYAPRYWFVMGLRVHATRLLTFVGRPVPDILKPAYNFGGLSMSQLARKYVDNWTKTRDSVNRMISNYSTSGVKTNMADVLAGGNGDDLLTRAELFSAMRDNQGTMLLDKETEEFFQVNTPLTTLDALQAQAQEHMASVSSMPLSILTGITPSGLNASGEEEIEIFHDHVLDMQRRLFSANLETLLMVIQYSLFGDYDPEITHEFVPLKQQSETEKAVNRKTDAETAALLIEMGAISAEEVRDNLINDENSGYHGITGNVPEPERDDDEEADESDRA